MPLLTEEQLTTMTVPHRQLIGVLEAVGWDVEVETSFPPYFVDCYLPQFHVAVEADGLAHSRPKDAKRDADLMIDYALPVYRVSSETLRRSPLEVLQILLESVLEQTWGVSLVERRLQARTGGADIGR